MWGCCRARRTGRLTRRAWTVRRPVLPCSDGHHLSNKVLVPGAGEQPIAVEGHFGHTPRRRGEHSAQAAGWIEDLDTEVGRDIGAVRPVNRHGARISPILLFLCESLSALIAANAQPAIPVAGSDRPILLNLVCPDVAVGGRGDEESRAAKGSRGARRLLDVWPFQRIDQRRFGRPL